MPSDGFADDTHRVTIDQGTMMFMVMSAALGIIYLAGMAYLGWPDRSEFIAAAMAVAIIAMGVFGRE